MMISQYSRADSPFPLPISHRFSHAEGAMTTPMKNNIPYEQIENGALLLELLRESPTWEQLCERYAYANPADLTNSNTMRLRNKLLEMRDLGLISFDAEETA